MDAALQSGPAGGGLALPAAATIVAAAPAHGIETDLDEVLGFAPNGIASATAPTSSCPPSPTPAPPPLRIPIRTSGGTSMVALAAVRFKRKAAKSRATQVSLPLQLRRQWQCQRRAALLLLSCCCKRPQSTHPAPHHPYTP